MKTQACPCGSSKSIKNCCELYHKNVNAPTALLLMKSRYSAYVVGDVDYLVKTTHPLRQHNLSKRDIKQWSEENTWQSLEIITTKELSAVKSEVEFIDVTDDYVCLGVFGPKSRLLMTDLSGNNFQTKDFPFGTGKEIKINKIKIWAQRLSYVGELGWELYISKKNANEIYKTIIEIGKKYDLCHAGAHAMDILRMEKGYLHWGHDISPEENQYEAGLEFAISFNKKIDFIGKKALLKIKQKTCKKKLFVFSLVESKPGEPLLLHDEPIYYKDEIIGRSTSGNYSFNFNKNMFFAYIDVSFFDEESIDNLKFEIEVEKRKYKVIKEKQALFDPENIYIRS